MPYKIVIIDDSVEIADLYAEILTDAGHEVVGTFAHPPRESGPIALLHPDLIIMDWLFGREIMGMRLLDMLAGDASTITVPIIVCSTARHLLLAAEEILLRRGVRIVHKPFRIETLLLAIEETAVSADALRGEYGSSSAAALCA